MLELACGPGRWTEHLARSAPSVTAIDAAPEMLAIAAARVGSLRSVRLIEADVFTWRPDRLYDTIVFGFWISHIPDDQFESFWTLVDDAPAPGGEVFFFDDSDRPDNELIDGPTSPSVQRRTGDGTVFQVIKIPHHPDVLERRLQLMGWRFAETNTTGSFYWAVGGR